LYCALRRLIRRYLVRVSDTQIHKERHTQNFRLPNSFSRERLSTFRWRRISKDPQTIAVSMIDEPVKCEILALAWSYSSRPLPVSKNPTGRGSSMRGSQVQVSP